MRFGVDGIGALGYSLPDLKRMDIAMMPSRSEITRSLQLLSLLMALHLKDPF